MSVKIYVGNLSYNASETQLKELFGQHGEVVSVKIIEDHYTGRSKGFGFIEMSEQTQAQSAIQQLNGQSFLERELKVNFAKPREEVRSSPRY
jgi:RNA recognition motif-containing protein